MAGEAPFAALAGAWARIPAPRSLGQAIGTFTRARVERIIRASAGIGSIALGIQSLFVALSVDDLGPGWPQALVPITFGSLALMVLACLIGRGVRVFGGLFAVVFIGVLLLWPAATAGASADIADAPWIWYLVNIATLAAVLAFPMALQITWTIATPVLYAVVRVMQIGTDGTNPIVVALDAVFALILGGMILTLAWLYRSVAGGVDEVRAEAVSSYAEAAAADAREEERVAVAALMHDSVLSALIAAERAGTPRESMLAVGMAREALTRLANAEGDAPEGSDDPWSLDRVAEAVETAAQEFGITLAVDRGFDADAAPLPGRVARALTLAATQAVANAIQHADAQGLGASVVGDANGVAVRVVDEGPGFAPARVPADRLGVSGSIFARVAAVGATAQIDTGSQGTTVTLHWWRGAA